MTERYAIMVNLDGIDDWIYVTQRLPESKNCWDLYPVVFESSLDAEEFAESWRGADPRNVKVVIYKDEDK